VAFPFQIILNRYNCFTSWHISFPSTVRAALVTCSYILSATRFTFRLATGDYRLTDAPPESLFSVFCEAA